MRHTLPTGRLGQALAMGLTLLVLAALWLGVAAERLSLEDVARPLSFAD